MDDKKRDEILDAMFVLIQQMNKQIVAIGNTILMLKSDAANPAKKPEPARTFRKPKT